ncbi:hypothetical protein GCM10010326_72320 [Streptomyces xanthochromogenes]|uniref:Uncharacterized protein n=1 Tax=Streptomyces xanthochromogenes TaxID=67384 RepID=A0ABQ3AUT1_9ACTN|nr:hypothetical protein GCM10010326_72320 [Streptomyces xanthochromogenes]
MSRMVRALSTTAVVAAALCALSAPGDISWETHPAKSGVTTALDISWEIAPKGANTDISWESAPAGAVA